MSRYVAGIDESGYGPLLGPLVTSAMMLRVPDGTAPDGPTLWSLLADCTQRPRKKSGRRRPNRRILVGDSKLVHSPGAPYDLERSVLALAGWAAGEPIRCHEDLGRVLDLPSAQSPWESPDCGCFPLSPRTELPVAPLAPANADLQPVLVRAHSVGVAPFNQRIRDRGNKAEAAWLSVASLLRAIWQRVRPEPNASLSVVVDRQGGRTHYGGQLEATFPGAFVWTVEESAQRSSYRVVVDGRTMEITFRVAADSKSWPCAAASLLAKYVRELAMARLNGFFARQEPTLRATAGYYADARRFLEETRELRHRLGIDDEAFIRAR